MARTTKKQLISIIFNILKEHPEKEVVITKYQKKLRITRTGLLAYCLCFVKGEVVCRPWSRMHPWSESGIYWTARLERLKLAELQDIVGRCISLTDPKRP